jgi:cold shock CspA family protein
MRGELLWFNEIKGFGFIHTEEDERLYVARSGFATGHVPVGSCAGTKVSFERVYGGPEGDAQAVEVAVVEDPTAGRARRRQRSFR